MITNSKQLPSSLKINSFHHKSKNLRCISIRNDELGYISMESEFYSLECLSNRHYSTRMLMSSTNNGFNSLRNVTRQQNICRSALYKLPVQFNFNNIKKKIFQDQS